VRLQERFQFAVYHTRFFDDILLMLVSDLHCRNPAAESQSRGPRSLSQSLLVRMFSGDSPSVAVLHRVLFSTISAMFAGCVV